MMLKRGSREGRGKLRDVVGKGFREVLWQKRSPGCKRDVRGAVEYISKALEKSEGILLYESYIHV